MKREFIAEPDESFPIECLDLWGQFLKKNIIYIKAISKEEKELSSWIEYADIERNLNFPTNSGLKIRQEGEGILVECERFARCVELTGKAGGNTFGWVFADNYFDLLPGEMKRIEVLKGYGKGTIEARGIYNSEPATCEYNVKRIKEKEDGM